VNTDEHGLKKKIYFACGGNKKLILIIFIFP